MTQDVLDLFRLGYFILYKTDNSWLCNAIVKRQLAAGFTPEAAQYTHCECSGGEYHAIQIRPPLSKLIKINEVHKGRHAKLVRFKNADYEQRLRYKVAYFSASLCNLGYDMPGIFSFLFKWIKQSNRLYFCSEGCAWALRMVFPNALGSLENSKIMPAHFLGSEFEEVWTGIID